MVFFFLLVLILVSLAIYFLLPKREKIGEKILRPYERNGDSLSANKQDAKQDQGENDIDV